MFKYLAILLLALFPTLSSAGDRMIVLTPDECLTVAAGVVENLHLEKPITEQTQNAKKVLDHI